MSDFCGNNWYIERRYNTDIWTVLQSKKLSDCLTDDYMQSNDSIERKRIGYISTFLSLIFLMYVLYKSMSKRILDFYRLILFNVFGIFTLILCNFFGPKAPGFNKVIAFGVLIHNLAEWFMIIRIWFGHLYTNALFPLIYVWIFMMCLLILPLKILYLFTMIQGATLDFTLVLTHIYLYKWIKQQHLRTKYFKKKCRYCYIFMGIVASMVHIGTVIPYFIDFALYRGYIGITIAGIGPTFIFYIWFISVDKLSTPIILAPMTEYGGTYGSYNHVKYIKKLALHSKETYDENDDKDIKDAINDEDIGLNYSSPKELNIDGFEEHDLIGDFNWTLLLQQGLIHIDKKTKTGMILAFIVGFSMSFTGAVIIWLLPCFIDTTPEACM